MKRCGFSEEAFAEERKKGRKKGEKYYAQKKKGWRRNGGCDSGKFEKLKRGSYVMSSDGRGKADGCR